MLLDVSGKCLGWGRPEIERGRWGAGSGLCSLAPTSWTSAAVFLLPGLLGHSGRVPQAELWWGDRPEACLGTLCMEGHPPICMSAVGWGGIGYPQRDFLIRVASEKPDSSEGPSESLPSPSTPSNPEHAPCRPSEVGCLAPGALYGSKKWGGRQARPSSWGWG